MILLIGWYQMMPAKSGSRGQIEGDCHWSEGPLRKAERKQLTSLRLPVQYPGIGKLVRTSIACEFGVRKG
jgi:hypothetical protein